MASRFRRYLNWKRDNRKWLLKALDEGPYEFKNFLPEGSTIPRLQTVEICVWNSGNTGRNNRRAYVQEEVVEGMNAQNETGNVQRTLRTPSSGNTSTVQCYNCSGKCHYARNCPKPRMEEIEELSANICLMARNSTS
ncbi:retrovirus-related pol polyprotein from transposon TNT 1-94 [Tanacetum coccineum]